MLAEKLPEASQINLEISDGLRVGVLFVGHGGQSLEVWLQGSKSKALHSVAGLVAMATTTMVPPGKYGKYLASQKKWLPRRANAQKRVPTPQASHGAPFGGDWETLKIFKIDQAR